MVTLINLRFIEVVFLYISPCNGGRVWPAGSTQACGRSQGPVAGRSTLINRAINLLLQKLSTGVTLQSLLNVRPCVRPMYAVACSCVQFTVYVHLFLMPFIIIHFYFVHSIHPCSQSVSNSYELYTQLQKMAFFLHKKNVNKYLNRLRLECHHIVLTTD